MDRETLSSYGWIVVVTLLAAVFLALASPLSEYIGTAITNYADALMDTADGVEYEEMGNEMEEKFEENDVRVPLN